MKAKTKKIMTLISLIIVILTSLPLNTFAAFITEINSNASFGAIPGSLQAYGHEMHYANYDGTQYMVFCTQYGKISPNGGEYAYNGDFIVQYREHRPEYEKIAEMIYFGYTMNYGMGIPSSPEAIQAAAATQQYVWEYINANIDGSVKVPSRDDWNPSVMSSGIYANWLAQTEGYYNQYHGNVSFNGSTNKIDIGDDISLSDANGVLQHYQSFSQNVDGITFSHDAGSNELKISVPLDCRTAKTTFNSRNYGLYELMPNGAQYSSGSMSNYVYFQFTSGEVQDLMFSSFVDPSAFSISIEVRSGKITIVKQDSETGNTPQGDATFLNAEYNVYAKEDIFNSSRTKKFYSKGDLIATRKMNEKGRIQDVEPLPLGKYIVKESVSSEGYLLDEKEYEADLTSPDPNTNIASNTTTSYEVVKKMQIHIFKSGIKENSGETHGLEGAEFTIKLNSHVQKALNARYTYAEIWNGIDENGNQVSVDKNRVEEAQKIAPSYEVLVTDSDGNAYSKRLPYGKYIVKETNTPKDYETASDFYFAITQDDSEVPEIAKKVKDLIVNNEQLESYIKLVKKDLETGKTVTLNSATFEIKAAEDILDRATKKVLYKKDETIKQKVGSTTYTSFTTNADNKIVPDGSYNNSNDGEGASLTPLQLPVGSYYISEIKVPEGFLQLDESVYFTVEGIRDYDKDADEDYIKVVEVCNQKPTGTIIVDKTVALRDNVDTSIVDISDLSGIQFKLTAKEDIIDMADGSIIYNAGDEVGVYNLDVNGDLVIEKLHMGLYELEEIKTLDGLVLNTEKYEIRFTQEDLVTKVYTETREIVNETTLVEFSKTDITGDEELVGAELTVLDENGKIIDNWVSTEKRHKIEGLVAGKKYVLREEIAPVNYVISSDVEFTVEDTNEIQKVTMVDKLLAIKKTDLFTGEELEGATLVVTDKDGNVIDEWVSGKEEHYIAGLKEGESYYLTEKIAPDGYEIAETIEFTVTNDKETQLIEMKDKPITKSVQVEKIDKETGEHIKSNKFVFGIYADENCTQLIRQAGANEFEGTALFEDLRSGLYYIKEDEAPLGYSLSDQIVKIEVTDTEVLADGVSLEEQNGVYSFVYYNSLAPTIQTGNETNYTLLFIIALISLIGITTGVIILKKRNNRK